MACGAMLLIQIAAGPAPAGEMPHAGWRWPALDGLKRAGILRQLESLEGKHLVFVRYNPWHDVGDEWVYNGADIDGSRVVWARELDRGSNEKLVQYFHDRRVWLVEPDAAAPVATPYQVDPSRNLRFVPLGAPGIESLHSADEVQHLVLEKSGANPDTRHRCDEWNYYFAEATGVAGPGPSQECMRDGRQESLSLEQWFTWLQRQKD
jgi:hypothetical protein